LAEAAAVCRILSMPGEGAREWRGYLRPENARSAKTAKAERQSCWRSSPSVVGRTTTPALKKWISHASYRAKRRYLKLVIGSVHLWKERNGVRRCGLVQTEETGPLLCLVKSHGGFMGLRRDYGHHRT